MKRFLLLLAMLVATDGARAGMLPQSPTPESGRFYNTSTTLDVAMCVVGGTLCGPAKSIPGREAAPPWINCAGLVDRPANAPAGAQFECRVLELPQPQQAIFVVCPPDFDDKFLSNSDYGVIPDGVSTRYSLYLVWRGSATKCESRIQTRLYGFGDALNFNRFKFPKTDAGVSMLNDWIAAQPIEVSTVTEKEFAAKIRKELSDKLTPGTVEPVKTCFVAYIGNNTTRPYYRPNAAKTDIKTPKVGDAKHSTTPCDPNGRLGTTNYYRLTTLGTAADPFFAIGTVKVQ